MKHNSYVSKADSFHTCSEESRESMSYTAHVLTTSSRSHPDGISCLLRIASLASVPASGL